MPAPRIAASLLVLLAIRVLQAQQPVVSAPETPRTHAPQVSFEFERPGLTVPKFTLEVHEDGSAHYVADEIVTQPRSADYAPSAAQHIDRQASISHSNTAQIFAAARELNFFNTACASKAKNIADTGKKTLRYTGEGGDGSCTYNFSQDKRIAMLTDLFLGIAHTLDMGRKLEFDHRYDRLGLDAETSLLMEDVAAGRAFELGTIAPTLKSIASDSEVLERVRARAIKLLQQAQPNG